MSLYHCYCGKLTIDSKVKPPLCTACESCHSAVRVGKGRKRQAVHHRLVRMPASYVCQYCHRTMHKDLPEDDPFDMVTSPTSAKKLLQQMKDNSGQG